MALASSSDGLVKSNLELSYTWMLPDNYALDAHELEGLERAVASISPSCQERLVDRFCAALPEYSGVTQLLDVLRREALLNRAVRDGTITAPLDVRMGPFDQVECMSGVGNLSLAMVDSGGSALALDKVHGDHENILFPAGLRKLMMGIRCLKRRGLLWFAPTCSTWIWLSRKQTERSMEYPWGNECVAGVADANCVKDVVCCLCSFVFATGRVFIIEQPLSSLMPHHPDVQNLLYHTNFTTIVTHHSSFSGTSPKPFKLFGVAPYLQQLVRKPPPRQRGLSNTPSDESLTYRSRSSSGRHAVYGKKEALVQSQAYTYQFGQAISTLHLDFMKDNETSISTTQGEQAVDA